MFIIKTEMKLSYSLSLHSAYSKLCSQLSSLNFTGADSFYVRVNLNIEPRGDPPSLSVSCDDIVHVTDTRYNGKYHWRCSLVDRHTAKPLQAGTMPNYNRFAKFTVITLPYYFRLCTNPIKWGSFAIDLIHAKLVFTVINVNCSIFHFRAQQLLLVRLRKMALEQKDIKKKVVRLLVLTWRGQLARFRPLC